MLVEVPTLYSTTLAPIRFPLKPTNVLGNYTPTSDAITGDGVAIANLGELME